MTSVGIEFPKQQARVRELLAEYKALGPVGSFGGVMLEAVLARADEAMASGDVVAVVRSFQELTECN